MQTRLQLLAVFCIAFSSYACSASDPINDSGVIEYTVDYSQIDPDAFGELGGLFVKMFIDQAKRDLGSKFTYHFS